MTLNLQTIRTKCQSNTQRLRYLLRYFVWDLLANYIKNFVSFLNCGCFLYFTNIRAISGRLFQELSMWLELGTLSCYHAVS